MTSSSSEPVAGAAPDGKPAAEILPADQFSQYLLHSHGEMFPVLRGLAERMSQITMTFNEGRHMVLTSLVSCDEDGLILDFGASPEMNRLALTAQRLFCDTQLDKVKIQFILRGVTQVEAGGRPAFRAELPESVLRLQRRESYRLVTSAMHPPKCRIRLTRAGEGGEMIEASVADISGGGVCLLVVPLEPELESDMQLPGCTIDLPDVGAVIVKLRLRRVAETVSRSGVRGRRVGCEFVQLTGPMEKLIQRYILKIERERKARESGLG